MLSSALLADYERLTSDVGLVDFSFRTRLEITGADRARVLHNLCTNEIRRLVPGDGCEAFLTNVKGKVIGFVDVYCRPDALVIETAPGQVSALLPHFDKYIITEDAQVHDRTAAW